MWQLAFRGNKHPDVARNSRLTCQALICSQGAHLPVRNLGAGQRLKIFTAFKNNYPASRALSLSPTGVHPVKLVILKVFQQGPGMVCRY
jgi:hypothetical protein